jgi:gliding motility-associated-like protein
MKNLVNSLTIFQRYILIFLISNFGFSYYEIIDLLNPTIPSFGNINSIVFTDKPGMRYNPSLLPEGKYYSLQLGYSDFGMTESKTIFLDLQIPVGEYGTFDFLPYNNLIQGKNFVFGTRIGYGIQTSKSISFGTAIKYFLIRTEYGYSAVGKGFDVGLTYTLELWKDYIELLKFAVLIEDVNTDIIWSSGNKEVLPTKFKTGISWLVNKNISLGSEIEFNGDKVKPRVGISGNITKYFDIRLGYEETSGICCGIGINYLDWSLDYSLINLFNNKPVKNWFGLGMRYGASKDMFYVKIFPETLCFSPNNDGYKDVGYLYIESNKVAYWELNIFDTQKKVVKSFNGKGDIPKQIIWDGKNENNMLLSDGKYFYSIVAKSKTGEKFSYSGKIFIDTQKPVVKLSKQKDSFVPSTEKNILFSFEINDNFNIEWWYFSIINDQDISVKEIKGTNATKEQFLWDGKDEFYKEEVKPGIYKVVLKASDSSGNISSVSTQIKIEKPFEVARVQQEEIKTKKEVSETGKIKQETEKTKNIKEITLKWKTQILFDYNKTTISKANMKIVEQVAKTLKLFPLQKVSIEGHADINEPSPFELSKQRAEYIANLLIKEYNINKERLVIRYHGSMKPVEKSDTVEGQVQNRRVEILIIE